MIRFTVAAMTWLTVVHTAQAQQQKWASIGSNGKESLFIDTKRITSATYPMGAAGNIVGVLTPKVYREAWVTVADAEGKTVAQLLWVFDCASRAGELAATFSNDATGSYDKTSSAQSIGVERYMQRIPPNSFYETAQPIVCKK